MRGDKHGDCRVNLLDALDDVGHGGQPFLLHEQRQRLHSPFEGTLDYFPRLGDEDALFGLELVAQLRFGEPRIGVEALVFKRVDSHNHDGLNPLWSAHCGKLARIG